MTVEILNRRLVNSDQKKRILEKEKIFKTNVIQAFRNDYYW